MNTKLTKQVVQVQLSQRVAIVVEIDGLKYIHHQPLYMIVVKVEVVILGYGIVL
jgi:hypothetical protein